MKIQHLKRRTVLLIVWAIVEYSLSTLPMVGVIITGSETSKAVAFIIFYFVVASGLFVAAGRERKSTKQKAGLEEERKQIETEAAGKGTADEVPKESTGSEVMSTGSGQTRPDSLFALEEEILETGNVGFEGTADYRIVKIYDNVKLTRSKQPEK